MAVKSLILTILGFVFLGLGAVGVAIPVMPTTPFILLAAGCFSVGNSRVSGWLQRSRVFGPYIENYRTKQGVSIRLKLASIIFLWAGLGISIAVVRKAWIAVMLGVVGACVTVHLLMIKTRSGQ